MQRAAVATLSMRLVKRKQLVTIVDDSGLNSEAGLGMMGGRVVMLLRAMLSSCWWITNRIEAIDS